MRQVREHEWGTMVWHTDSDPDSDTHAESSSAEMTIRAGCTSPPHRHGNCDEQVYVRNGQVTLVVDGDVRGLRTGDRARVARGAPHHVIAAPDAGATLVLVWSAASRDYEELSPGG